MRTFTKRIDKLNIVHGLILLLILAFWMPGFAQAEIAGHAYFIHGKVTATRAGQTERTLSKGAEIFDQDTLQTAAGARAQLRFTDGGLLSLMPETTLSVEEYHRDEASPFKDSLVFSLVRGGLRTVTGAIGKTRHDAYELKTPVGSLGIRGTEFTAQLNPPDHLWVYVGRGMVALTNDEGTLDVGELQSGLMVQGQAPEQVDEVPDFSAPAQQGNQTASGQAQGTMSEQLENAMPEQMQSDAPIIDLPIILPPAVTEALENPAPPVAEEPPVVIEPPVVEEPPVVIEPPVEAEPPVVEPPVIEPPVIVPPVVEPPVVFDPPVVVEPPVDPYPDPSDPGDDCSTACDYEWDGSINPDELGEGGGSTAVPADGDGAGGGDVFTD